MAHSHLIIPRLFVGDCIAAEDLTQLQGDKVSHVVALGGYDFDHPGLIYKVTQ